MNKTNQQCPCLSGKSYETCCGIYLTTDTAAPTPEALMRSRYTAYTELNIDYIGKTMQGPASEDFNQESTRRWAEHVKWLGLEVLTSKVEDDTGYVEFKARYLADRKEQMIHELSEFKRIDGKWFYTDGEEGIDDTEFTPLKKIGRNDPCPCGSNKKYKKCCSV